MKNAIVLLLLSFPAFTGYGQTYFTDSFESDWSGTGATAAPAGWTQKAGVTGQVDKYWNLTTWNAGAWTPAGNGTYQPVGAYEGRDVAHYTNFGATADQTDSLISPVFDLSAAVSPVIEFHYAFPNDSWYGALKLLICKPGTPWELIGSYSFTGGNTGWTDKFADVPEGYNVNGVKLAFVVVAGGGSNADLWLDGIILREGIKPLAPTGLTFDNSTSKQLTLTWTDNADNETSYLVYRSDDGVNYSFLSSLAANSTSYVNLSLAWGTTYYYKIYAVTEAWSNELAGSATTKAGTMAGNYNIGTGEDYTKIQNALLAVNYNGLGGPVTFTLTANYDETSETYPVSLVNLGASASKTITITDADPGNNNLTHATFIVVKLNGAKYYILDGLSIVAESNIAVQITNDASFNTIQNCTIKSNVTNTVYGVVTITAGSVTGNDYNTISNCNIGPNTSTPLYGIYAETCNPGQENDNNSIIDCEIHDFFITTQSPAGIYIKNYNTDYTISGNSIYQTAGRNMTSIVTFNGISINAVNGNNFSISNNKIGGSEADCGGTPWTITGTVNYKFNGIYLACGNTIASSIQGNKIANMEITSSSSGSASQAIATGIYVSCGDVNIGTQNGNTIGSLTASNSFKVTGGSNVGYPWFAGIMVYLDANPGVITVKNNNIGGLSGLCSNVTGTATVKGILILGTSSHNTVNISGNTVGGESENGKITAGDMNTTSGLSEVLGIEMNAYGTSQISNNTVRSLTAYSQSGATKTYGIKSTRATLIDGNLVYNISGTNASASLYGIYTSFSNAWVINNMIRLGYKEDGAELTTCNLHGLYATGSNLSIYHNSVYIGGTGVESGFSCSFCEGGSEDAIRNNIFVNTRSNGTGTDKHYCYFVGLPPNFDYNLAFATGTGSWIGCTSGIDRNWADWQGLGFDIHGINEDPLFVNATGAVPDLHLASYSPADAAGVSGLGVISDIDNENRMLLTPVDIGADAGIYKPTFVTDSVYDVWFSNAYCRMTVTNDGGCTITTRGVCWSTSQNPTIADGHTTVAGSGLGSSTHFMPDLVMATKYYVRAYVITEMDTAYGNQLSFSTNFIASVSGNWDDPATWGGSVPDSGTNIEIGYGINLTVPAGKASVVCHDLYLNPTAKLTVDGTLHVQGDFQTTMDDNGSATVIDNGTLQIDGTKSLQLVIPTSDRYYYISIPFAGIAASVFGNIATTEFLYMRNTLTSSWDRITNGGQELIVGTGYAVKLTGSPRYINFSGSALTSGNFNPVLTYGGDNWNLIGNPYPSAIDWGTENDPTGWSFNNVRNTIYVKHGGTFAIWNGAVDGEALNGGTRVISPMQSFWVKALGESPSAGMNNLIRVHNNGGLLKSNVDFCQKLRVKVAREGFTDEALLKFHSNSENSVDKLDAEKLFATDAAYPQLYMNVENEKMAIASHSLFSGVYHQPLAFRTEVTGQFTFTFSEMESFGAVTEIYLEDKVANKMVNLNLNPVYSFESGICNTDSRFVIHIADGTTHFNPFDYPGTTGIDGLGVNVNVYGYDNSIFVKAEKAISATVKVYNLLGAEVARVQMDGDFAKIELSAQGHYIVKVLGCKISKVEKVNID